MLFVNINFESKFRGKLPYPISKEMSSSRNLLLPLLLPQIPRTPPTAAITEAHTKTIKAHSKDVLTWQTNNAKVVSWIIG
ncbi:hypothetical protein LINGRAHAP2_LOCUS20257 [Linum grandiflorum]